MQLKFSLTKYRLTLLGNALLAPRIIISEKACLLYLDSGFGSRIIRYYKADLQQGLKSLKGRGVTASDVRGFYKLYNKKYRDDH